MKCFNTASILLVLFATTLATASSDEDPYLAWQQQPETDDTVIDGVRYTGNKGNYDSYDKYNRDNLHKLLRQVQNRLQQQSSHEKDNSLEKGYKHIPDISEEAHYRDHHPHRTSASQENHHRIVAYPEGEPNTHHHQQPPQQPHLATIQDDHHDNHDSHHGKHNDNHAKHDEHHADHDDHHGIIHEDEHKPLTHHGKSHYHDDEPHPHPTPARLQQGQKHANVFAEQGASMSDVYFLAVVAGCSIAGVVGLIVAGVCWYRLQKNVKAASEAEYPAYGVTGPTTKEGGAGSPGDRKLAHSAQMYHYQHQKQQMLAMEKANGDMNKDEEVDSEEENEEGDYTVYECPGLAPTGEMEVKNPLFSEETPVTPAEDTNNK